MMLLLLVAAVTAAAAAAAAAAAPVPWRPAVLMHGLGGSASDFDWFAAQLRRLYPGMHVLSCQVGNGGPDSLSMPMNQQVAEFDACIRGDPVVAAASSINMLGHSQGGLITRAWVQRHNSPPVHNLMSLAGPHGGQFGVPNFNSWCPFKDTGCGFLVDIFDLFLNDAGSWANNELQQHFSFATYWRDPFNLPAYLKYSQFLADVNNARDDKNATYKKNLESLNLFQLVMTSADTIVHPKSSPWFEHYVEGQDVQVQPLKQTQQYTENWLGLKTLDARNALPRLVFPCPHPLLPEESCGSHLEQHVFPLFNNTA